MKTTWIFSQRHNVSTYSGSHIFLPEKMQMLLFLYKDKASTIITSTRELGRRKITIPTNSKSCGELEWNPHRHELRFVCPHAEKLLQVGKVGDRNRPAKLFPKLFCTALLKWGVRFLNHPIYTWLSWKSILNHSVDVVTADNSFFHFHRQACRVT